MKIKLYFAVIVLIIGLTYCKDPLEKSTYFTADIPTLISRMEQSPDTFGNYIELLKIAGYYNTLISYGNYTCFVPDNEAIQTYITSKWGVSSVSQLTSAQQIEDVRYLLKFHILLSKKRASSFAEGRLSDTTGTGDFLTTSFTEGGGINNVYVNKKSKIIAPDISADNGVIHVIDKVLDPFIDPVPVVLEKNGGYTIFVEAMKQTGYFDDYSEIYTGTGNRAWFTIFAEPDAVYNTSGISSFAELANSIAPGRTDYTAASNPLNQFIAYHTLTAFYYTSDLPDEGFLTTNLLNAAIKCQKSVNLIKLNETETGVNDKYVTFIFDKSNTPTRNGVYHSLDQIMTVFTPKPKFILFDLASDQPEYQAGLVKAGTSYLPTMWEYVDWYPETRSHRVVVETSRVFNDRTNFDLGGAVWYEFITPVIPKGKYEFLVCALSGSARGVWQVYWDGEPVGALYQLNYSSNPSGWPDSATMESYNWRKGHKWIKTGTLTQDTQSNVCRFIITRELLCPVQKRHTIRFVAIKSGGLPIDYVEWIPVN
jgi:uncharacterized surface protein with fasciclin (FAS1) repeats